MSAINSHLSCTMTPLNVLALTTIIGLTSAGPLPAYEKRDLSADRTKIFLLLDQRAPELEKQMLEMGNFPARRTKRIGSLSIVNNLDVLRQRVLLELARRKALQDQRQIDANRRFLDTIGKRSASEYRPDVVGSEGGDGSTTSDRAYAPANELRLL